MSPPLKVVSGDKYARLTIIKEIPKKRKHKRNFLCQCVCGNKTEVLLEHLRSGNTKSCGCLSTEVRMNRNNVHNKSGTRIYNIWGAMKQRCHYKSGSHYNRYGGRGITICKEWYDFKNFYDWAMSNGYSKNLSLDRKDNDGDYTPENCRWATTKQQARNHSRNVFIEYKGKTKCLVDWADVLNINYTTLTNRIDNWGIKKALETPSKRFGNIISYKNESMSQSDWAKKLNISAGSLSIAIKNLGPKKAIEKYYQDEA